MEDQLITKIKNIILDFFAHLRLEGDIRTDVSGELVQVDIKMEEPAYFIGHSGQVLFAVQHLLRVILRKQIPQVKYVDLDINDYKKNKINYLREVAREAAEDVALLKKPKQLPPMPAYERRIIHLEISGRSDVTTESVGQGPERRVEIRPVNTNNQ